VRCVFNLLLQTQDVVLHLALLAKSRFVVLRYLVFKVLLFLPGTANAFAKDCDVVLAMSNFRCKLVNQLLGRLTTLSSG
jgi:hypothetical protein